MGKFQGPGLQKHHQNSRRRPPEREKKTREDTQREKKRAKMEAGEGKKRKILGGPAEEEGNGCVQEVRREEGGGRASKADSMQLQDSGFGSRRRCLRDVRHETSIDELNLAVERGEGVDRGRSLGRVLVGRNGRWFRGPKRKMEENKEESIFGETVQYVKSWRGRRRRKGQARHRKSNGGERGGGNCVEDRCGKKYNSTRRGKPHGASISSSLLGRRDAQHDALHGQTAEDVRLRIVGRRVVANGQARHRGC